MKSSTLTEVSAQVDETIGPNPNLHPGLPSDFRLSVPTSSGAQMSERRPEPWRAPPLEERLARRGDAPGGRQLSVPAAKVSERHGARWPKDREQNIKKMPRYDLTGATPAERPTSKTRAPLRVAALPRIERSRPRLRRPATAPLRREKDAWKISIRHSLPDKLSG